MNPDCEVGRYLTDVRHFAHVPAFAGTIDYHRDGVPYGTLAMLQALVPHQGDGWTRTLERLDRFFEECGPSPYPAAEADVRVWDSVELSETARARDRPRAARDSLDDAMQLGRRTAEMHLALAAPTDDPAFAPEPLTDAEVRALGQEFFEHGGRVFDDSQGGVVGAARRSGRGRRSRAQSAPRDPRPVPADRRRWSGCGPGFTATIISGRWSR